MQTKMNHYDAAIRVCVDQAEGGHIIGRAVSRRLTAPIFFSDIGSLLLQLEEVFNQQNFPQAFERTRSFTQGQGTSVPIAEDLDSGMTQEEVTSAQGSRATFALYVITRRNTTWQGFVDWLDDSPRQEYASVLELLKVIDEFLFPMKL